MKLYKLSRKAQATQTITIILTARSQLSLLIFLFTVIGYSNHSLRIKASIPERNTTMIKVWNLTKLEEEDRKDLSSLPSE